MAESIIATMNALNSLESSRHRPSIFIRHEFITILTQRRTIFAHFARENVTKKKKRKTRSILRTVEGEHSRRKNTPKHQGFENDSRTNEARLEGVFFERSRAIIALFPPLWRNRGWTVTPPPPTVFLLITSPLVRRFFEKPRETIR